MTPRAGLGAVAALGLLAAGCAATTSSVTSSAPPPPAPLANAVETNDGTWATVAMGQLDDPANTYWQLLYRAAGSSRWVDDAADTATATNGGVALAAAGGHLVAGVEPAQALTFSPVVATSNAGRTWDDGLLPAGLASTSQALATSPTGATTALLGPAGPDQRLVSTAAGLTQWRDLTTGGALATAAPGCGVDAVDSVAYTGSGPVVGTSCSRPGAVGIFAVGAGGPMWSGPSLRAGAGTVEVLALSGGSSSFAALLEERTKRSARLVAAFSDPGLRGWTFSAPMTLDPRQPLTSVVSRPDHGFLVLAGGAVWSLAAGGPWQPVVAPPTGTAAVVPLSGGALAALVVDGATLTDWDLPAGGRAWVRGQVMQVPILFGSTT